jgi:hypothetical protein
VGQTLTPVDTTAEGVELVRQDKFVMIMEGSNGRLLGVQVPV